MVANEISRARGNTVVILCSEVIYLFTYYLSINIWYLIRLKVVIIEENSLGVVPNLTARWRWRFLNLFIYFFCPFGVPYHSSESETSETFTHDWSIGFNTQINNNKLCDLRIITKIAEQCVKIFSISKFYCSWELKLLQKRFFIENGTLK